MAFDAYHVNLRRAKQCVQLAKEHNCKGEEGKMNSMLRLGEQAFHAALRAKRWYLSEGFTLTEIMFAHKEEA